MKRLNSIPAKVIIGVVVLVLATAGIAFWLGRESAGNTGTKQDCQQTKQINNADVCVSSFIGLHEAEALQKAQDENLAARVVSRDGKGLPIDLSLQPDRLNFTVVDDKVTQVEFY